MYEYKATIVRVVDGDTVDVDIDLGFDVWLRSQRIRLFGVDTPECRTRNKATKAHGLLAKKYVQEALKLGEVYAIRTREKIKVGRTTINKLLIKEKLAVAYTGQNKKDIAAAQEANRLILVEEGKL
jgi:micrococcal nuclease